VLSPYTTTSTFPSDELGRAHWRIGRTPLLLLGAVVNGRSVGPPVVERCRPPGIEGWAASALGSQSDDRFGAGNNVPALNDAGRFPWAGCRRAQNDARRLTRVG
jgi:hypothetical protein